MPVKTVKMSKDEFSVFCCCCCFSVKEVCFIWDDYPGPILGILSHK